MIRKERNGLPAINSCRDAAVNSLQKEVLIGRGVMDIFLVRDGHPATREFTGMAPKEL